jgi:site-specific DNA recombinase
MEQRAGASATKRELERVKREIQKVIDAIVDGVKGSELKDRMAQLQERKDALLRQIETAHEPPPLLHPSMADLYRSKVEELASALQREDTRLQASEMLRGLIDSIVLIPDEGQLRIELRGNLAAMLTAAQQTKRSPETGDLLVPVQLVAGARNHLDLEFVWAAA